MPVLIHFYDKPALYPYSSILHRYVYTHIYTCLCTYIYFPEGMFTYFLTPMKVLTLIEQELLGTRVVGYFQFICLSPNFFPEKVYLSGVFSEKRKKKQWGKAAGRTGHVLGAQRVSVYL